MGPWLWDPPSRALSYSSVTWWRLLRLLNQSCNQILSRPIPTFTSISLSHSLSSTRLAMQPIKHNFTYQSVSSWTTASSSPLWLHPCITVCVCMYVPANVYLPITLFQHYQDFLYCVQCFFMMNTDCFLASGWQWMPIHTCSDNVIAPAYVLRCMTQHRQNNFAFKFNLDFGGSKGNIHTAATAKVTAITAGSCEAIKCLWQKQIHLSCLSLCFI